MTFEEALQEAIDARLRARRARQRAKMLAESDKPLDCRVIISDTKDRNWSQRWSRDTDNHFRGAFDEIAKVCKNPHLSDDDRLVLLVAVWDIAEIIQGRDDDDPFERGE